ncbi:hypothetical protein Syun_015846 [Stephania yunnanensis]|uniref:C2H2-type domain-containing protein n=1 Tax=Stephania yunnanensis TaxID=152371 RepID=A0AAP0J3Y9_9MAGN
MGGSHLIIRSYECTFCQRGFSNAQALGGHMNIHRRDRAKLKQHSSEEEDDEEDQLPLPVDATTNKPSDTTDHLADHLNQHHYCYSNSNATRVVDQVDCSTTDDHDKEDNWPLIMIKGGASRWDKSDDQILLPTSVDLPSSSSSELDQIMNSSSSSNNLVQVDLELRLGPDPLESTNPACR